MTVPASVSSDRRGVAILEFALILPLLIVLVAGVIDLGRAFVVDIQLYQAVRAGGQMALAYSDPTNSTGGINNGLIEATVSAAAPPGTSVNAPSYKTITCATTDATCTAGNVRGTVTISASVPFNALIIPLGKMQATYVERYQ